MMKLSKLCDYVLILFLILFTISLIITSSSASEDNKLFPCSKCHSSITIKGPQTYSEFHNKNLNIGSHFNLNCLVCHDQESDMMYIKSITGEKIPLMISRNEEISKICSSCHGNIYEAYLRGAHGNHTMILPGDVGRTIIPYGYIAHNYERNSTFTVQTAKSCIDCHDPHDPSFKPLSPLPPPSSYYVPSIGNSERALVFSLSGPFQNIDVGYLLALSVMIALIIAMKLLSAIRGS